ncbi:TonB-dependent receptor [Candidatus Neomarinimicrobiota bacterium]
MKYLLFSTLYIFYLFSSPFISAQESHLSGIVLNADNNKPVIGASVMSGEIGVSTDMSGEFILKYNFGDTLQIQMIGYAPQSLICDNGPVKILLEPVVLTGMEIDVVATRVIPGITPVAYSTLTSDEISKHYTAEDIPMILSNETGVHAYSESGNGTGYSYVSIRGFDQSRIAVMIDNVPLNDNENHEVYWVDHGDILADASDVEIQRGIGNSLYGATAFGGSINIQTKIKRNREAFGLTLSSGSYNTAKANLSYNSGVKLGNDLSFAVRLSKIKSDGYRSDSSSDQNAVSIALEKTYNTWTHQLRTLVGKEISRLQWDGISADMINDRDLRVGKMEWTKPFTDNFLQQIYSINSRKEINPYMSLRNVLYGVFGSGYYEVRKFNRDFYSYNLDVDNEYTDEEEMSLTTDLDRRKWIVNQYFGITPILTYQKQNIRFDAGFELRHYSGQHFGEVFDLSDAELVNKLPNNYRYYDYDGQKQTLSIFAHLIYTLPFDLNLIADLQIQDHSWSLEQKPIGHFVGHDLSANWNFINPRLGMSYKFNEDISVFVNYGSAEKEPSDGQIIEADDVSAEPKEAASENIRDYEVGFRKDSKSHTFAINLYRIDYNNEILSDIYDFYESEFEVETADKTRHEGIEFESQFDIVKKIHLSINGSLSSNRFTSGDYEGEFLTNVPDQLLNISVTYSPRINVGLMGQMKYVGKQYIDLPNSNDLSIAAYAIANCTLSFSKNGYKLTARINNLFDTLYSTYGYNYYGGYYWPGATRNYSITFSKQVNLQ